MEAMTQANSAYSSANESLPKDHCEDVLESLEESSLAIPHHPLCVRPLGNAYTSDINAIDWAGHFQILPAEVLVSLLEYLDSRCLRFLGSTCTYLYPFCRLDEIWKTLSIRSGLWNSGSFIWRGSWFSTYLNLDPQKQSRICCSRVFSDMLYRPFLCTYTPLAPYSTGIPTNNAIPRLENLSPSEFDENWSNKPFILTRPVRDWPIYKSWNIDTLTEQYGEVHFRAEAVDWTFKSYVEYMQHSNDESPLYLFDRGFVEKMGLEVGKQSKTPSYWIPESFGEDLFSVLGDQRPDSRWLIIGPARSGSSYHKDPNHTSAWNAVIRGCKYWIMFPSDPASPLPPGVYVSQDQSEVTSPLSIAEWLFGFHAEARRTPGCMEGICNEGEVLHVPSGWWHLVINLDESIAITQNFVGRNHLADVLSFLRDKPDQVSGFKKDVLDPYGLFVQRMRKQHPALLDQALDKVFKASNKKKRRWDEQVGGGDHATGFSFGFGADSDEEVP